MQTALYWKCCFPSFAIVHRTTVLPCVLCDYSMLPTHSGFWSRVNSKCVYIFNGFTGAVFRWTLCVCVCVCSCTQTSSAQKGPPISGALNPAQIRPPALKSALLICRQLFSTPPPPTATYPTPLDSHPYSIRRRGMSSEATLWSGSGT